MNIFLAASAALFAATILASATFDTGTCGTGTCPASWINLEGGQ